MAHEGPRTVRAKESLREIGPSVIKGGFTTWLGLSLAFTTKVKMFHYFIKPLTLGVCFGLFHGIICIPLACYYFGPESVADIMRDNKAINGGVQANNATERKNSKDIEKFEVLINSIIPTETLQNSARFRS